MSPHPIDKLVGKRLRTARHLEQQTQMALAEAIGVKFQQVQKYETGANRISASNLHTAAKFLKRPIGWFFDENEPEVDVRVGQLVNLLLTLPAEKRETILGVVRSMKA